MTRGDDTGRPTGAAATRARLIRAAEQLFAEHGIEGASLREVNRRAGQSNTGAVQYHFGDRKGLLLAIIAKHWSDNEPRRHALLDQYEESGEDDLRVLAAALVLPLAAKLSDPDGGRAYLRISAEFYSRPAPPLELVPDVKRWTSIHRWHVLLSEAIPVEDRAGLHTRFAAIRFAFTELARRAEMPPRPDDRAFTSHLVDMVTALLATRPSPQTLRALGPRRAPPADDLTRYVTER
jgi:AcrR family transcriptional regulator